MDSGNVVIASHRGNRAPWMLSSTAHTISYESLIEKMLAGDPVVGFPEKTIMILAPVCPGLLSPGTERFHAFLQVLDRIADKTEAVVGLVPAMSHERTSIRCFDPFRQVNACSLCALNIFVRLVALDPYFGESIGLEVLWRFGESPGSDSAAVEEFLQRHKTRYGLSWPSEDFLENLGIVVLPLARTGNDRLSPMIAVEARNHTLLLAQARRIDGESVKLLGSIASLALKKLARVEDRNGTGPVGRDSLLLDAREAATLLGISRSKFLDLDKQGLLPRPIYLGRSVRWSRADLDAWIAAGAPKREEWERIIKERKICG